MFVTFITGRGRDTGPGRGGVRLPLRRGGGTRAPRGLPLLVPAKRAARSGLGLRGAWPPETTLHGARPSGAGPAAPRACYVRAMSADTLWPRCDTALL